jgi:peptide deformylase
MAVLEICTYPDPVLREAACEIVAVDGEVQEFIDDMVDTMYDAPGIGLAANQVGRPVRIVVVDIQRPECEYGLIVLVNPEIVSAEGSIVCEEGCLSVPDYFANVKRSEQIIVRGLNREGKPIEITASGLLSVALQHEIDHLDGKLFVDRLGVIARDIFKRKYRKKLKEAATA